MNKIDEEIEALEKGLEFFKKLKSYEPQWSAEEQTMVDLMELNGYRVVPDTNMDYHIVQLIDPKTKRPVTFRADTAYEAIRKAFTYWTKHNA
jgi:hypothetical protein